MCLLGNDEISNNALRLLSIKQSASIKAGLSLLLNEYG
jgi:hypothetical protein